MNSAGPLKTTPLHEEHVRAGARLVPFGSWNMPVQYSSIIDEHHAVRKAAGLFDISHMGELVVTGRDATRWLDSILTNHVARLGPGECHYTFLLNEQGGVIDDLIVYHRAPGEYLLVVNASMVEADYQWMRRHVVGEVTIENQSDQFAALALQGPKSADILELLPPSHGLPLRNRIDALALDSIDVLIARTGYTGEDGFEIFLSPADAPEVWRLLLQIGAVDGLRPCGLGARDTLRLEMCYPLNGSDLSPERTPLEAGLGTFVDLEKGAFIGRDALLEQRSNGLTHRLVALRLKEKSPPPRAHYGVYKNGVLLGELTSGTLSPSLKIGIGLAYLPVEHAQPGAEVEIDIRGKRFPAMVAKKPLYRPNR